MNEIRKLNFGMEFSAKIQCFKNNSNGYIVELNNILYCIAYHTPLVKYLVVRASYFIKHATRQIKSWFKESFVVVVLLFLTAK